MILVFEFGVDRAVAFAHVAAHGVHGRPAGKVDSELALDRRLELRAAQLIDQRAEMAVDVELGGRMRAWTGNLRIVSENGGKVLAFEEVGNDDEIERVALERRTLQGGEIAIAHGRSSLAPVGPLDVSGRAYTRSPGCRQELERFDFRRAIVTVSAPPLRVSPPERRGGARRLPRFACRPRPWSGAAARLRSG